MSDPSSDLLLDRSSVEAARRSAFAVTTHNPEDFEGMRRAGRLAAEVLDLLVPEVKPGVTTEYLDKLAYDYVVAHGALPAVLSGFALPDANIHAPNERLGLEEMALGVAAAREVLTAWGELL